MKDKKKKYTINIEGTSVIGHIGSRKHINDDWGTLAFLIPRNEVRSTFVEQELRFNSIYMLISLGGGTERVYVGQAKKRNTGESALARLREHDTAYENWNWAVVFTGKSDTWSAEDLNALEKAMFMSLKPKNIINTDCPSYGGSYDAYEDKIRQIKNYVTAIGFNLFDDTVDTDKIQIMQELPERLNNGMRWVTEIVTPSKVVKQMCDMLPSEVWNEDTVFLDMACKGGEYLREIFDRLMECERLKLVYPDERERLSHIIRNQIYGLALSPVSLERTTKKLLGFGYNIRYIEHYTELLKGYSYEFNADGTYKKIDDVLREEFGTDMKVDVVIGNPPYQYKSQSIYPLFIEKALDISKRHVEMIVRNNWMASDTLKDTRDRMINSGLKEIINYPVTGEVFPGIGVAVNIFHVDRNYSENTSIKTIENGKEKNSFNCSLAGLPIVFRNELDYSISNKVRNKDSESFAEQVYPIECFRIKSNLTVKGKRGTREDIDFVHEPDEINNIRIYYMEDGRHVHVGYISKNDIPNTKYNIIDKWKVICGKVLYRQGNIIYGIKVIPGNSVCTSSFGVLYVSKDKNKAINAAEYIKTKFFRYLVGLMCDEGAIGVSSYRFTLAPMVDLDKSWTDVALYAKFGLSDREIDYIETTIKEMD